MPAREEVLTKKMEEYVKESAFANAGNRTALSLHTSKQHIFKNSIFLRQLKSPRQVTYGIFAGRF